MNPDAALNRYLRSQELGEAIQDYADDNDLTFDEAEAELQDRADAEREAYWEAMAEAEACRWDDDPSMYGGTYSEW
jgi:hypothetical protein